MVLHFLKENALEALRTNLKENLKHYAEESNDWIYNYFTQENPFEEYKMEFSSFELKINESLDFGHNDVNNAISLYSAMRNLTDSEATDERLWAGMCHSDFWNYLRERGKSFNSNSLNMESVRTRYFFTQNRRRSLITNTLSKLWWIGRLTYDSSRSDPFELTRYLSSDFSTKILIIFSNNFISNPSIAIGFFSALIYLEKAGYFIENKSKRSLYYEAIKYLNVLGGTCLLDYFTAEELEEKIVNYMLSLKGAKTL